MTRHFEVVCFDHDGLLVDTEVLFFQITRDMFHGLGVDLTEELWSREYLSKGRGSAMIAGDFGISKERIEPLLDARNQRYRDSLPQAPLRPHAREVLTVLHGRVPLALVTGNNREAIEIVHRSTGLLSLFSVIVTQEDFPKAKPAPDAYLTAAKRLGLAPERCLAVEDSERGLASAVAAGMPCIAVPGSLTKTQSFPGALAIEETLERIPAVVITAKPLIKSF